MQGEEPISVWDYLTIAEAVTSIPAFQLSQSLKVGSLESALAAPYAGFGEVLKYAEFHERAAILCSRLVRNHPLVDGNKRCAWLAMTEFIERNGRSFPTGLFPDAAETIENLAAGTLSEDEFVEWVAERIS